MSRYRRGRRFQRNHHRQRLCKKRGLVTTQIDISRTFRPIICEQVVANDSLAKHFCWQHYFFGKMLFWRTVLWQNYIWQNEILAKQNFGNMMKHHILAKLSFGKIIFWHNNTLAKKYWGKMVSWDTHVLFEKEKGGAHFFKLVHEITAICMAEKRPIQRS